MTPEEMEKQINVLTKVIGNQAVMLHSLKEKVQSIYELRDSDDSLSFQIFEIVDGLNQWANECDQTPKFDFSQFTFETSLISQWASLRHEKCGESFGVVDTIVDAIMAAESHVCPNSNPNPA